MAATLIAIMLSLQFLNTSLSGAPLRHCLCSHCNLLVLLPGRDRTASVRHIHTSVSSQMPPDWPDGSWLAQEAQQGVGETLSWEEMSYSPSPRLVAVSLHCPQAMSLQSCSLGWLAAFHPQSCITWEASEKLVSGTLACIFQKLPR